MKTGAQTARGRPQSLNKSTASNKSGKSAGSARSKRSGKGKSKKAELIAKAAKYDAKVKTQENAKLQRAMSQHALQMKKTQKFAKKR